MVKKKPEAEKKKIEKKNEEATSRAREESPIEMSEDTLARILKRRQDQEKVREKLNKDYGDATSGIASSALRKYVPRISTGAFEIDLAMGGGWPRGRINMAWGSFSGGKTTTMLRTLADAQKRDVLSNRYIEWLSPEDQRKAIPMNCAWIDVEGSFDRDWAHKLGVDLDRLEYTCPASQEEACSQVEAFILSGAFDCIFLDSLAAMASEKEVEGEMGDHNVGVAARLNNKMFRKVQSALNRLSKENGIMSTPTFFFVNQERHKIGVTYGPTTTKPGGSGQEFFTSVILHLAGNKVEFFDNEKRLPRSVESHFKIDKNKTHPPKVNGSVKSALVDDPNALFLAGEVIDTTQVMDLAGKLGIYEVVKNGFRMFDEIYKRKMDLAQEWVADRKRYSLLKGVVMTRLLPHQAEDWKFHVEEEEKREKKQSVGDEAVDESGGLTEDEQ